SDWHGLVIAPFAADGQSPGDESGPARVEQLGGRKLTSVQAAYKRRSDGYDIELALPRSELDWMEQQGARHALDIAINDRDLGKGRETQLIWYGTDRDQFSSRYYGRIHPTPSAKR